MFGILDEITDDEREMMEVHNITEGQMRLYKQIYRREKMFKITIAILSVLSALSLLSTLLLILFLTR